MAEEATASKKYLKVELTKIVNNQEIPQSQTDTNPWYRAEEPHNNHETPGRQTKQSNQLSLPRQDECKTRMDTK